jgi:hypothetical protein
MVGLTCSLLLLFKNRDVAGLVPVKQEEDHANVTPDSSATANSKSDLDNSLLPLQVRLKS